ncbi:hypothetical protein J2R76_003986 [Bradyrhizobium sp. USDA 4532]|uniref:hypothetical protein n=1 Tax=unclassified Bradyrhizobium TaxID=2631580 RepID=UPI0020A1D3B9|nr:MULTISPECIES: hypothetical protein [unclassified Bradyrhizobium]MCP1835646.1 hypothetical protein [Bradyrhizobium sp. USDA 4545]MCP1920395.1 hypothetical protein [Bradyrhizobium sp. USDA 4532]
MKQLEKENGKLKKASGRAVADKEMPQDEIPKSMKPRRKREQVDEIRSDGRSL